MDLRREKVDGERGEDGSEMEGRWKNLGLFFVLVLHWSFGLSVGGSDDGGAGCTAGGGGGGVDGVEVLVAVVRHRNLGLETGWDCNRGVEGLEKKLSLELSLGVVGLLLVLILSCFPVELLLLESRSLGIDVQKALRHPKTILSSTISPSFPRFLALLPG